MKKAFLAFSAFLVLLSLLMFLVSCKYCWHDRKQRKAENVVEATETSEGSYDEVVYCMDCKKKLSVTNKVLSPLACLHSDANEDFACDKCAKFFVELGHTVHTYDREVADDRFLKSEANCTETAVYYKSCGCGKASEETFTQGWVKHNFEDKVDEALLVSLATCKSPAVYYKSCECGEISEETFKKGERLSHVFENEVCTLCSEPKRYVRDGDYVYFGEFPQTIKSEKVSITNVPALNGVYIGSDGERYLKVVADPYYKTETNLSNFSNGEIIVPGKEYYFKIEPIKWRIILEEDDTVLLSCETIIANMAFDADGNNSYFSSDLYEWFNGEFLNSAFNEVQREIIIERTSQNYTDSVYTLPEDEIKEQMELYTAKKASDYSRATGAYFTNYTSYYTAYGIGGWWSSSAYIASGPLRVEVLGAVAQGNTAGTGVPTDTHVGVCPFVKIELR